MNKAHLDQASALQFVPWHQQLQRIIDSAGGHSMRKNKAVSNKTREERARVLFQAHRHLIEGGFHISDVGHLKPKHVRYLMSRWEAEGLTAATLQSRLSILNTFAGWIGKPGLVQPIATYLSDPSRGRRQYVATSDKSWSASSVDIAAKIAEVSAHDAYVGAQLSVIAAFGLRRKEGVMFKPFRADKRPDANVIELTSTSGTKGGRPRTVPITSTLQEEALAEAKALAKTANGHIGNPTRNLKQNLDRFSNVVRKFGITCTEAGGLGVVAHGLRHEYANDRHEEISGVPSPVRCTDPDDLAALTRDQVRAARLRVSEELGHSREQVASAYYGPIPRGS
jgi:integrase